MVDMEGSIDMDVKDRVQFAHSIDTGSDIDYTTAFTSYFDQLMAVYNIIQPFDYSVEILTVSSQFFIVGIKFYDVNSVDRVVNIISQLVDVTIYGRKFFFNIIDKKQEYIKLNILY